MASGSSENSIKNSASGSGGSLAAVGEDEPSPAPSPAVRELTLLPGCQESLLFGILASQPPRGALVGLLLSRATDLSCVCPGSAGSLRQQPLTRPSLAQEPHGSRVETWASQGAAVLWPAVAVWLLWGGPPCSGQSQSSGDG